MEFDDRTVLFRLERSPLLRPACAEFAARKSQALGERYPEFLGKRPSTPQAITQFSHFISQVFEDECLNFAWHYKIAG